MRKILDATDAEGPRQVSQVLQQRACPPGQEHERQNAVQGLRRRPAEDQKGGGEEGKESGLSGDPARGR